MTNEKLIEEVMKRKVLIITSAVIVFIMAFFLQYRVLQTFKASTTIIVNETDVSDMSGPSNFIADYINSGALNVNRLFKFAYSTEMMDHLIKKFNLYEYYQIKKSTPFAYQKILVMLSNRIILSKTDQNIIVITVTDRDRFQAASMANEIASMLNTINENYIKKELKRKIAIYQGVYENAKIDLDQHEDKMNKILENYREVLTGFKMKKEGVDLMIYSFKDYINNLKTKRDELVKMKELQSITLETLNKERLETITVINTANPDYHSNTTSIVIISFVMAIIGICFIIFFIHVYLSNQKYIQLIFKK